MSDEETRELERKATGGDHEAARSLLDRSIRTRTGWVALWRAGPTEPAAVPSEGPVSFVVGRATREGDERWPAWAAWVGSVKELWTLLGALRGKKAYLVDLATGAAFPVGGTPAAIIVCQREDNGDPQAELPRQVRDGLGEPDPANPLVEMLQSFARLIPRDGGAGTQDEQAQLESAADDVGTRAGHGAPLLGIGAALTGLSEALRAQARQPTETTPGQPEPQGGDTPPPQPRRRRARRRA